MNIPYLSLEKCFHVGDFDLSKKRHDSYEGYGLSISIHPNEWMKIARLPGRINTMSKKNSVFADYYGLSEDGWKALIEWGIKNSYVEMADLYKVEWYDDEWEQDFQMLFKTYQEAKEEGEPIIIKGLKATEKMNIAMKHDVSLTSVKDFLFIIYIDKETDFDGVWWDENLNVNIFSAPRGCILPRKLNTWKIG